MIIRYDPDLPARHHRAAQGVRRHQGPALRDRRTRPRAGRAAAVRSPPCARSPAAKPDMTALGRLLRQPGCSRSRAAAADRTRRRRFHSGVKDPLRATGLDQVATREPGPSSTRSVAAPGRRGRPRGRDGPARRSLPEAVRSCRCRARGEVVAVAAGELVLPDELMQPAQVHERQPAQVQHDVAHAIGLWLQAIEHLGDLRHREQVEFAPEARPGPCDGACRASTASCCGGDRSGCGEDTGPPLLLLSGCCAGGRRSGETRSVLQILAHPTAAPENLSGGHEKRPRCTGP